MRMSKGKHLGRGNTAAKTECMYVPGPHFFTVDKSNCLPPSTTTTTAPLVFNPADDTVDDDNQPIITSSLPSNKEKSKVKNQPSVPSNKRREKRNITIHR